MLFRLTSKERYALSLITLLIALGVLGIAVL